MIRFNILTKYVYIILAIVIIYNSFGYVMLYFPATSIIKAVVGKSIKDKKIKPEDLSILVFSIDELKNNKYDFIWEKPEKEFRFNGKMYDIEDKKETEDSVYYTCYYDHKENIIEELFSLQFADHTKDTTTNFTQRVILVGLYSENIDIAYSKHFNDNIKSIPLPIKEAVTPNPIEDIPTPPPRLIV
ncbi:MAG: hypothetical protein IPJ23_01695 [Ignavibacteriales bacterium]|nr:hypothetical protein [Ignavibacteriales bacterium]